MEQLDFENSLSEIYESFEYMQYQYSDDEYIASLGRFESMYFDIQNFTQDPVLGYSRNPKHSYFYQNISSNFCLTGGLAKLFAQYGILLAIIILLILGISSIRLATEFNSSQKTALFLVILISSISYDVWCVPIFTAVWLNGLFGKKLPVIKR